MSGAIPKNRNRYKVAEAKQQMRDKVGGDKVTLVTDADHEVEIEHPMFRSKETKAALKPLADDDDEGIARVVLGDKGYDTWVADGHDASELEFIFRAINADTQDALAGRKRPTRS